MNKSLKYSSLLMAICLLFSNCYKGAGIIAKKAERPLNIILMIGDGMGLAQISAASVLYGGLNLELFRIIGLVKTSSADDYITDSAAGATAYSAGQKTFNGAIGVGIDSLPIKTILEMAEANGLSSGLISTCSVTHATPASFFAHRTNREMHREIASDLYGSGIDFIAGSGKPFFEMQKLMLDNYIVHTGAKPERIQEAKKYFWFYNDSIDMPKADLRPDWLSLATTEGIRFLSANKKGFFMMVEGSQIDWGGHDNDLAYMAGELLDFDKAVKAALDFAIKDGNTLLIITADHETGGLSLDGGSIKDKKIEAKFSSTHHSGIMVPIFAFGPGAENFSGILENTDVFKKMKSLYGF